MDSKIQKNQKQPTATSEGSGAKAGYCPCPLHRTPPKGWANHLSNPFNLTPGHTPTFTLCNEPALPSRGANKRNCYLFFTHPCHCRSPNKALPEFLVWPLINIYCLGKAKNPDRYQHHPHY